MNFVSRAQWGARTATAHTSFAAKNGWAIHWEGTKLNLGNYGDALRTVQTIQADHMEGRNSDKRPWSDIAYNFLVSPFGDVFEGRGFDNRSAANGNTQANAYWGAICYLGGPGNVFTPQAMDAINYVIQNGPSHGFASVIHPHSFFYSTQCPGDDIRNWIANNHPNSHPNIPMPGGTVHYDPPVITEPIISSWVPPEGGVLQLAASGAIYGWGGAQYRGGANGKPYFAGRTAHHIEGPRPEEAGKVYVIVDTANERYAYPE